LITKIDMNSPEFLAEFEKTETFTDKVCEQFGFAYTPFTEVKESIQQGLTRNKLIYGKRYCPCFMVIGSTPEEQAKADNRLCPCTPALTVEIPQKGKCHCTIFCTPEHARELAQEENTEEVAHTHARGLSKEECDMLMKKEQLDGNELEALLDARENGSVKFNLRVSGWSGSVTASKAQTSSFPPPAFTMRWSSSMAKRTHLSFYTATAEAGVRIVNAF